MSETRPVSELHPHDRADLVPPLDHAEYEALMADIEANGTQVPLDILFDGTVLDGRTRLMIARALWLTEVPVRVVETPDPVAYMIRMAIMRRHLTIAQRKTLAAHLLRQEPERSDRSVAKVVGVHHETVAAVRDELVEAGDVAVSATRLDTLGRKQPAPRSAGFSLGGIPVAIREPTEADREFVRHRLAGDEHFQHRGRSSAQSNRRLPIPKRTRPLRPWARYFTTWCRQSLPEDRDLLLRMRGQIDAALEALDGLEGRAS